MKKEFVPHEIALELKHLGFDEPCLSYYEGESFSYHLASIKGDDYIIPAPLFQQAFRWFRDKHNIVFYVNMVRCNMLYFVIHLKIDDNFKPEDLSISQTYDNYEEAELACLNKLIEIVKSKTE